MNETEDQRAELVALLRASGLDSPGLADRLERRPAGELLREQLSVVGGQPLLFADDPARRIAVAAAELSRWEQAGLRLLSVRDPDYPRNLRLVHDRPPALWLAGDLGPAPQQAIAVIGSRRPTPTGLARAERLAAELVAGGQIVISGLAAGIDTAAHRAALAAGGATIAVIGTGLGHAYPPENRALQTLLAAEQAVLSPFWPETGPSPETFHRRNGVMSGLARATVIVEASEHSGTRVQARLALAHGRPVCLMEPVLDQPWAAELAQRPGVHVVSGAAEVLAVTAATDDGSPLEPPV